MDDELLKLEAELKRIQPVEPSLALKQRIALELHPRPNRSQAFAARWIWFALPLAAAAIVLVAMSAPRPAMKNVASARTVAPAFKPVTAENVLLSSQDEGFVTLSDGTPARRVRQTYVDTITWKNAQTNASLTWSLPREEVRFVLLNLQ